MPDWSSGAAADAAGRAGTRIAEAIFDFIGQVPETDEPAHRDPAGRARRIGNATAARAALSAGGLALPPGPLGWLTILPELRTVWKQQARMVADIAGAYGRTGDLSRETMIYCLFRHVAPGAFRSVVRHHGDRFSVRRVTPKALHGIALKIGVRISLRVLGRGVTRWVPVVGALGVGAYAFYDTGRVAATATELFAQPVDFSEPAMDVGDAAGPATGGAAGS